MLNSSGVRTCLTPDALRKKWAAPDCNLLIFGGGGRNRTGVHGFAGRCMTTLPPRRVGPRYAATRCATNQEGERWLSLGILERERSLELPTSTLARLRSTN